MKAILAGALAVLGTGYTVAQRVGGADKPVDIRVDAATEGIVAILLPAGNITVEGWRNSEIQITGTLASDNADITVTSDHSHAEINLLGDADVPATLHIRIPRFSNLDIETTEADFTVASFNGIVRFESVNGSFTVDGQPRGVVARSVTGDINIPAANVPGFAHSEEGTVRLGPGTGRLAMDGPHGPRHKYRSRRYEQLGEKVSDIVSDALEGADFDGLIAYDDDLRQLDFDLSGSLHIDLADLDELFEDVNEMLEDIGDEIGENMEALGKELEGIGDDLQRKHHERRR